MFSLMGNCISCIKKRREPKRQITLALLGLDCAGKTTTTKVLTGEPFDDDIAPTVGFNSEKFTLSNFNITMFDLGGGRQIRRVWKTYFAEVYGIVYMLDSTASERMEELKENFQELIQHEQVAGKPILLLANKQDKENALDEVDICEQLDLEATVNIHRSPCRVESCSALKGTGRKMDKNIKVGLQWLCDIIEKNYESLKERVVQDMAEAAEKKKLELAARREHVRKMREERDREEEEERKRLGIEKAESEGEDMVDGDPFKPVNLDELSKKEVKMKEDKKKLKELKAQMEKENEIVHTKLGGVDEVDYLRTPRSNRTYGLSPLGQIGHAAEDSDELVSSSTARSGRMLPPLQQPLGTKFMDEPTTKKKKKKRVKQSNPDIEATNNNVNDSKMDQTNPSLLDSQTEKSMSSVSKISITTKSMNNGESLSSRAIPALDGDLLVPKRTKHKKKLSTELSPGRGDFELQEVSELRAVPRPPPPRPSPGDMTGSDNFSETEVRKVKKKKPRKNQLSPALNDDSDIVKGDYSSRNYPWDSPNRAMNGVSDFDENQDLSTTRWGLAEDLPDLTATTIRTRPNYDDDDDIVL